MSVNAVCLVMRASDYKDVVLVNARWRCREEGEEWRQDRGEKRLAIISITQMNSSELK